MSVTDWGPWVAPAVFAVLYALGIAASAVFWEFGGHRLSPAPRGQTHTPMDARLIATGGRGLAIFSAVGEAFALAIAVHLVTEGLAWQYAASGAGMFAVFASISLLFSVPPVRNNRLLRVAMEPPGVVMRWAAIAAGFVSATASGANGVRMPVEPTRDVTAALAHDLERLEQSSLEGDSGELRMIKAVLSMDTARVREIMRPRVDMVVARADATPQQLVELINEKGHSKIPIYEETIDEIVGVVFARDLLRLNNGGGAGTAPRIVREIARPAIFVPESQRLEQLLREFQRHRTQIATVVDEYGGVSGLVTVQDLIEEIVGEIVDEFDRNEPDVEHLSDDEALMDARLPIDSFNEMFGVSISPEGFDTVGGLVYRELGKMPVVGDTVDVQDLRISVESTMGRRIRRLRVKRTPEMPTPV